MPPQRPAARKKGLKPENSDEETLNNSDEETLNSQNHQELCVSPDDFSGLLVRAVVLEYMLLDTTRSDTSTVNSASAPPPEPSLIERTCTAMLLFLSSTRSRSTPPEAGGSGRGKSYTTEQQHSCIERLKAQSKATDKTIKTLQKALRGTSARQGDSVRGGRCGRGNGRRRWSWQRSWPSSVRR